MRPILPDCDDNVEKAHARRLMAGHKERRKPPPTARPGQRRFQTCFLIATVDPRLKRLRPLGLALTPTFGNAARGAGRPILAVTGRGPQAPPEYCPAHHRGPRFGTRNSGENALGDNARALKVRGRRGVRRRPASLARDAVSSRTVLHSPDACVLLDVTAPLSTLECLAKLVSDCKSLCRQTEATTRAPAPCRRSLNIRRKPTG